MEYSNPSFSTDKYANYRPTYPLSFIEWVVEYQKKSQPKSEKPVKFVDLGCGTGQVTFPLAGLNAADIVVGADPSEVMIEKCKKEAKAPNLEFVVVKAEELSRAFEAESVDLITAAECFHWFDHAKFFEEAYTVLKKGGTLAYWMYIEPVVVSVTKPDGSVQAVDIQKYNEAYNNIVFGDEYLGPYWEQPGRNNLRQLCANIEIPHTFKDVVEHRFDAAKDGRSTSERLKITRQWTLENFRDYISSFSATHAYEAKNGAVNIPEMMVQALEGLGFGGDDVLNVVWSSAYYLMRK